MVPVLIIAAGYYACRQIKKYQQAQKITAVLGDCLLGTICATLLVPVGFILISLAFTVSAIPWALSRTTPALGFDWMETIRAWAAGIPHEFLVACGPGATIGVIIGIISRRGKPLDGKTSDHRIRTTIEITLVALMMLSGWAACIFWPLDLALNPAP